MLLSFIVNTSTTRHSAVAFISFKFKFTFKYTSEAIYEMLKM